MRFAVFTHVIHREQKGKYYAYSPYIREMNLWFKYVEEVEVVSPLTPPDPPLKKGGELSAGMGYEFEGEIEFTRVPSFNFLHFWSGVKALVKIPLIFYKILGTMRRADHLHLRCPGNIGLLAAIAQIFFRKKPKTVKYAGNWDPEANQPWTYRLQKWILSNTFLSRNIKVLVYGDWPGQNKNIVPFFTASFSEKDREVVEKDFSLPYKFIYTGNLVEGKGLPESIMFMKSLKKKGVDCNLEIYGDGILEDDLKQLVQNEGLEDTIGFKGRLKLEDLKEAYRKTHFSLLLSKSEGWPKAVAEAMWFGCVPVASPVSCLPWMLGDGSRGVLVQGSKFKVQGSAFNVQGAGMNNDECNNAVAAEILALIENPEEMKRMSLAAQEWSQEYTLERFEEAIRELLDK